MSLALGARRKIAACLRDAACGRPINPVEAERLAAMISPRKRPPKVLPFKTRKQSKAIKKAAHREETGAIREAIIARSGGNCEFCGGPSPSEMHHLEGGTGRRRQRQAVSNCLWICAFCHREYHRDPFQFAMLIAEWAALHGYRLQPRIEHQPVRRPAR